MAIVRNGQTSSLWRPTKRVCPFLFAALMANPALNAAARGYRAGGADRTRACWQGEVRQLDTVRALGPSFSLGPWISKVYRLCQVRDRTRRPQLTVIDVSLRLAPSPATRSDPVVDWQTSQQAAGPLALVSEVSWQVTVSAAAQPRRRVRLNETTRLRGQIEAAALRVRGVVYGTADGQPWFVATWQARFRRVCNPRQVVRHATRPAHAAHSQTWLIPRP